MLLYESGTAFVGLLKDAEAAATLSENGELAPVPAIVVTTAPGTVIYRICAQPSANNAIQWASPLRTALLPASDTMRLPDVSIATLRTPLNNADVPTAL